MFTPLRALRGFLQRWQLNAVSPPRRRPTYRPRVESLEARRVLASTNLPVISGTVFQDVDGNGMIDAGEAIAGATIRVFQDDGDGIFNLTTDTQVGADFITLADDPGTGEDETGTYCFDSLDPDLTYFVQQPAQTVGTQNLSEQVSPPLSPGVPDLLIDDFISTQTTTAQPPPVSSDESSLTVADETEIIGAERDLAVSLEVGNSEVQLRVNPFGLEDVLLFDSSAGTQGLRTVTWDGLDNDGDVLAFGLNGRDLTEGGVNTGIVLRVGVDANGASSRIRLFEGSETNFIEATVPIPVTGGAATGFAFVPFADFVDGGDPAQTVDPANVDAIQLILETGNTSVDGQVDVIGIIGPEVQNFANTVTIDLDLEKTVDRPNADNGDNVTWTLTLTNDANNANSNATGIQVGDVLPAGVTLVNATASGNGTFSNGTWDVVDPLAPGASATLTLVTSINSSVSGGTALINTAQVIAADQVDVDSTPNNDDGDQSEDDEDSARVTVNERVDVELDKTVDVATANTGDTVTFTVTATNNPANANADATNVQIGDALPAGLTLLTATPSGGGTFTNGIWDLANPLAPGASATLTLVATVDAGVAGNSTITNVAQVVSTDQTDVDSTPNNDDGDQSEDDEDAAAITIGAVIDLELTKSANTATANVGDTVIWTLNLTNNAANANAPATGVQVTDVLPVSVTLVNSVASGNGVFAGGVWNLVDPLTPGATATLTLTTTIDSSAAGGAVLTNVAQVSAVNETDVDSTPNNDDGDQSEDDEDAANVTVGSMIDLELTKTANVTNVLAGDTVTWTVMLTNNDANANASATGVTVTDVVPTGVTLVNSTPSDGTFDGTTWTLANPLAPGATARLTLFTSVDSGVSGGDVITNVAQVSSANETDVDSTPNNDNGDQSEDDEDSAAITVDSVIDLQVTKSVDATLVNVGDNVVWTIVVTNDTAQANTTATGVQVTDVLPPTLTFVSSSTANGAFDENTGIWTLASSLGPGQSATLTVVTTVNASASATVLTNAAQVSAADQQDVDSTPNNDDGDQSEDDEDPARVTVLAMRPAISKRDLLASAT